MAVANWWLTHKPAFSLSGLAGLARLAGLVQAQPKTPIVMYMQPLIGSGLAGLAGLARLAGLVQAEAEAPIGAYT